MKSSLREESERRTQLQDTLLEVQKRYEQLAASRDGGGRLGREVSTSNELRMDKLALESRLSALRQDLTKTQESKRKMKQNHSKAIRKFKETVAILESEKTAGQCSFHFLRATPAIR